MRYLSLFSGIEAASVAWKPLGWECAGVAEIEAFPCSLLNHYYPNVPNLGNVSNVRRPDIQALGRIDLVVFGSPCQDLSIAGKRAGMKGARSGLFFTAIRIIRWSRARFALWENVPGAYSSNEGRDFAEVVGKLSGLRIDVPEGGWRNTGVVAGFRGLVEWSTLDAQWFGVPQRRRRIFALADFGDWASRSPILLEPYGLQGHHPPSREAGQGTSHGTAPSLTGSGRGVARTGESRGQDPVVATYWDGGDITDTLDASNASKQQMMPEKRRFHAVVTPPLTQNPYGDNESREGLLVPETTHFLTQRYDSSEDGCGRGTPLAPCIAFSCKDHGSDASDIAPTLRSMGHDGSHANAGGQVAVAFNLRGRDGGSQLEPSEVASLRSASGGSSKSYIAHSEQFQGKIGHGKTPQANTYSLLRVLRDQVRAIIYLTKRPSTHLEGVDYGIAIY